MEKKSNLFRKKSLLIAAAFGISVSALPMSACSSNTGTSVSVSQDDEKEREEVHQLADEFLKAATTGETDKMYALSGENDAMQPQSLKDLYYERYSEMLMLNLGNYKLDKKMVDDFFDDFMGVIYKDYSINDISGKNGQYTVRFSVNTASNSINNTMDLAQNSALDSVEELDIYSLVDQNEYLRLLEEEGEDSALKYMYDSIYPELFSQYIKRMEEGIIYKNTDGKLKIEKNNGKLIVSEIDGESVSEYIETFTEGFLEGLEMSTGLNDQ